MCCCELPSEWPPPLQISPIIKYLLLTGPVINSKIASSLHLRLPLGPELALDTLSALLRTCRIISLLAEHGNCCTLGRRSWHGSSSLGTVRKILPEFAQNLQLPPPAQRQRELVAFPAKPSFLQSRFMELTTKLGAK